MEKKISLVITYHSKEDRYMLSYKVNGITQEAPRRDTLESILSLAAYYIKNEAKGQEEVDIKIIQKMAK